MTPASSPDAPRLTSRAGLATTLAMAMAAGPLAVFAVSALAPTITADLGLSRLEFGLLATVSFAAATPSALVSGRLADVLKTRRALLVLFAGSALSLGMTASAPTYGWLLAAVTIAGVAMSMSNPVTNQIVSREVPPGQRGGIMGVKQSGVQIGQLLAGGTLPVLASLIGWRGAVAALSLVVAAGAALAVVVIPDREAARVPERGRRRARRTPSAVWTLVGYTFLTGAALQATVTYLPLFAFEQLSLTESASGLTLAVIGGTGLIARIGWGRATDKASGATDILMMMSAGGACASALLLTASRSGHSEFMWAAIVLSGGTVVASNVVVMMTMMQVIPSDSVGAASGVLAVGLYAGFAIGPVSFGAVAEGFGYDLAWIAAGVAYAVAGALIFVRDR